MAKLSKAKKLIVHNGTFHADDVMCAAIMRRLNPEIEIERVSEVPECVGRDTVVADIGGGKYDHHQDDARKRSNGENYSACGLLLEECWKQLFPKPQDYRNFVGNYIIPIERQDNGTCKNPLSTYIAALNPTWRSGEDEDECFEKAVSVLYDVLDREIKRARAKRNAERKVKRALRESDGDTVVLQEWMPYDRVLGPSRARFVIYPDERGQYKLRCIPGPRYGPKCHLPEAWLDERPAGCTFIHPKRFLAAFDTMEDAINAARSLSGQETRHVTPEPVEALIDEGKGGVPVREAVVRRVVLDGQVPCVTHQDDVPNAETAAAMGEVERMKADPDSCKSYKSFRESVEDMDREEEEARMGDRREGAVETFHYRGLDGSAEVSIEDGCLHGKILGIKDLVIYEGNTVQELEADFRYMVDFYLEDQAELGRKP